MNTHFGICKTCGFSTSISRNSGRCCPKGHGELLVIDHRYAKLINRKNDTGQDRLRKLNLLLKQSRIREEESRIGKRKRIGTGKFPTPLYLFLHPHTEKIK